MFRSSELRRREVINIKTAEKLGFICEVEICTQTGKIESVIVPCGGFFSKIFLRKNDLVIPWEAVIRVGKDIVLVDYANSK